MAARGGRAVPRRPDDELTTGLRDHNGMQPTAPSGQQYEIRHGAHRAVVAQVGASLRSYDVDGRPVLDGYAAEAMADGARGQVLAPWPNRVQDGTWSWNGEKQQLALTEPDKHNAIHGLVRWLGWTLVEHSDSAVRLAVTTYPQPGYKWPIRVETDHCLDDSGLTVKMTMTNLGTSPAPVAAGVHPYLTVGTDTVDDAELQVPADTWLDTDAKQQIPTGARAVEGTPYDFRQSRVIGTTAIDYAYTDLHRDADGRCRLRLSAPDGQSVALWVDETFRYLEVFTGDALPDPSRRRKGLGTEPMTAPPNALATGVDLVVLEPGESWTGCWGIEPG
jgi:aldose 1-epimerase